MMFSMLTPQEEDMQVLKEAYNEFNKVVAKVMFDLGYQYDLVIYGSTTNGLAMRSAHSDLDLSIVVQNFPKFDNGEEKAANINKIMTKIKLSVDQDKAFSAKFSVDYPFAASYGWQLNVTYRGSAEVKLEIFVNKVVDAYNTWLVYTYAALDIRFLKLALVLKYINKQMFKELRLNSYSIIMMLIAYLQREKVLPCLQKIGHKPSLIRYDRYIFEDKKLKDHQEIITDVYFVTDVNFIQKEFGPQ